MYKPVVSRCCQGLLPQSATTKILSLLALSHILIPLPLVNWPCWVLPVNFYVFFQFWGFLGMGRNSPEIPELAGSQTPEWSYGCWHDIFWNASNLTGQSVQKYCQMELKINRHCPNSKIIGFVTSFLICVLKKRLNSILRYYVFCGGMTYICWRVCSVYNSWTSVFWCSISDLCLAKWPLPFLIYLFVNLDAMVSILKNHLEVEPGIVRDHQLTK